MNAKGRIVAGLVAGGLLADTAYAYAGTEPPDYKTKHTPPAQAIVIGTGTASSASASSAALLAVVDAMLGRAIDLSPYAAIKPSGATPADVVNVSSGEREQERRMPNTFRRVSEPDTSAITVTLWQDDGNIHADVAGPVESSGGYISRPLAGQGGGLSVPQALNMAISLANKGRYEIVVCDDGGLWQTEWGTLT
jgi:hypothetical protein